MMCIRMGKFRNSRSVLWADVETRLLDELHIDESIDPRLSDRSEERLTQYAENVDNLPPILVDAGNRVLDGIHRLRAHKLAGKTEIKVKVVNADTRLRALTIAIKDNAIHGVGLTVKELQRNAIELYDAGASDAEIAETISRSTDTVHSYLKEAKAHRKDEAKKLAAILSDQGYTQTENAELIKEQLNYQVGQRSVSTWLRENPLAQEKPELEPRT